MRLVSPNLPPCLPSLATGLVPAGQHYYEGSEFCQPLSTNRTGDRRFVLASGTVAHPRSLEQESSDVPHRCSLTIDSRRSVFWQTSLLIAIELPSIPSPTTLLPFRQPRFITLPSFRSPCWLPHRPPRDARQSGIALRRADCVRSKVRVIHGHSPTGLAESSSLTLRTALSPQVAPHLSSRKRSYRYRLQGGNDTLDGTFTHQFNRLHRRTCHWLCQCPVDLAEE